MNATIEQVRANLYLVHVDGVEYAVYMMNGVWYIIQGANLLYEMHSLGEALASFFINKP